MNPPLRRGDFVLITTDKGQAVHGMVTLASQCGKSIVLMFDAMIGGWVQMMPCSQVGSSDRYEALDGMPVTLRRLTREELDAYLEEADAG